MKRLTWHFIESSFKSTRENMKPKQEKQKAQVAKYRIKQASTFKWHMLWYWGIMHLQQRADSLGWHTFTEWNSFLRSFSKCNSVQEYVFWKKLDMPLFIHYFSILEKRALFLLLEKSIHKLSAWRESIQFFSVNVKKNWKWKKKKRKKSRFFT